MQWKQNKRNEKQIMERISNLFAVLGIFLKRLKVLWTENKPSPDPIITAAMLRLRLLCLSPIDPRNTKFYDSQLSTMAPE